MNNTGCSGVSNVVTIVVFNKPYATITASGPTTFCNGDSVSLSIPIAASYLWSNGDTTQTIIVNSSGNYNVQVTNVNGCSAISSVIPVVSNNKPNATINASGPLSFMAGQTVNLSASGGTTYLWNPGGETSETITVSMAGIYKVTAFNSQGCSAVSNPMQVTISQAINATINYKGNQYICLGKPVALISDAAYAYKWTPGGETTQSILASQAGIYKLTIYNSLGDSSTTSISVFSAAQPSIPTISMNYIPNAAYQLTANSASAACYIWSVGDTVPTINVLNPATLSVVCINSFGCISDTAVMTINSISGQPCGKPDMLTSFEIIDTAATIAWNPAVTGDSFTLTYWVTGTTTTKTLNLQGNQSSFRLYNLLPGTEYKWKIQTNCLNISQLSTISQFTTLSLALPCGSMPKNLSATNITTNSVDLNWYNTTATSFKVRYRLVGTSTFNYQSFIGNTASKGGTLIGLLPNTMYEWNVQSNCNGVSTNYTPCSYFSTINPCGYMGIVAVPTVSPSTATISWANIASMDTIRIRITNAITGAAKLIIVNGINNTGQFVVNQLKPNTLYYVDLKGKCSDGSQVSWTNKVSFTTSKITTREMDQNPLSLAGYPNPTNDYLNYTFESEKYEDYTLKVSDMSGRELLQEIRFAENGSNGDVINVNHFTSGMYLLIIQKGAQISHFRFNVN